MNQSADQTIDRGKSYSFLILVSFLFLIIIAIFISTVIRAASRQNQAARDQTGKIIQPMDTADDEKGEVTGSVASTAHSEPPINWYVYGGHFLGILALFATFLLYFRSREQRTIKAVNALHHSKNKLRDSEDKFQSIFNAINDTISIHDLETGRIIEVNQKACEMFKCTREEAQQSMVVEFSSGIPPYDHDNAMKYLQKAASGEPQFFEWQARDKEGRLFWVDIKMERATIAKEDYILCVLRDITKHKRAEEALRKSEEKYRGVFDESVTAVYLFDEKKHFIDSNPAGLELLGYTREELLSMRIPDVDAGPQAVLPAHKQLVAGDKLINYEHKLKRKNGEIITVLNNSRPIADKDGQVTGMLSTLIDITEHKKAQEALRKSEEGQMAIIRAIPDIFFSLRSDGTFTSYHANSLDGLYIKPEEFLNKKVNETLPPELAEKAMLHVEKTLSTGELQMFDYTLQMKGSLRYYEARMTPINDSDVAVVIRDNTDRLQAQEKLREKDRFQAAILNDMLTFVGILKPDGEVIFANNTPLSRVGYSLDDVKGKKFYDGPWWSYSDDLRDKIKGYIEECAEGKSIAHDVPVVTADGELIWLEFSMHPVYNQEGNVQYLIPEGRDITDRKQAEEKLRESQKMEVVGQLAGGVAHDFNNLLQAIKGYTDLAAMQMDEGHPAQESIHEIASAGKRAATLIQQMLAFSRRQVLDMKHLDLNDVMANVMGMIQRIIGEHVTLQIHPGNDLARVYADPGQIEQILLNLCVNARDAMPEGGMITIKTRTARIDADFCRNHPWAEPGSYVLLSMSDTGCGMDKETLGCIFEPFFTTKEVGKGTGLGLSMVYGLIKQHKGICHVSSEVGKGTTFEIYLPQVEHAVACMGTPIEADIPGGNETILLAEDNKRVLKLTKTMLEQSGYTIFAASDGEEALNMFKAHGHRIDLALLDVMMPKIGGKGIYKEICKVKPDMRFIFASGYNMDALHRNFMLEKGLTLIQKPYEYSDLLCQIRKTLD